MSTEEIKKLRRLLKKAHHNGNLQEISDCCCNLAAYLSEEDEHEEALKLYQKSLAACENLKNKKGIALANRMIAEECIKLGYYDDALNHVGHFLQYSQDERDKVEEQRGLVLKGHVYFTQAEFLISTNCDESEKVERLLEQSMEAYKKSFSICKTELNDINEKERLQMKARLLQNISLVLMRQNKLDYAQAHLIKAIKICTKEKLNDTEHLCYLSLGDLFIKKEEPEKALTVYDKVFELSHSTQKRIDSLVAKAKTLIIMENYEQAKNVLKKAYKLKANEEIEMLLKQVASLLKLENNLCSVPDTEFKARRQLYKKLGNTYCSLNNYKKGIKNYLNMLGCAQKGEMNRKDLLKCYHSLCSAFTNDKQYDKALFYSHQQLETISKWDPDKACKIYLRIGKLHELNGSEFEEIHFAYVKAKNKAFQFENHRLQKKCLKLLIHIGNKFNKRELVEENQKELQDLKSKEEDLASSCDSGNDSNSEGSTDSETNCDQSSDIDIKDLLTESDNENEEYDRPKERCKRTKFTIKRNEKGETDLHVACIKGNYKRVKLLIDQGHSVNLRDAAGWTPLHEACNYGYLDIVNLLIDYGANINDKGGPDCDGTTPLHDAATNGQLPIIKTLIKRGASTLVLNDKGETPLQCLLAWKKKSAMDEAEDLTFKNVVKALKSPLDSDNIRRHLKNNTSLPEKKLNESNKINSTSPEILNIKDRIIPKSPETSAVLEYKQTMQLLRRKRQVSEQRNSKSESSDEDICFRSFRRSFSSKEKSDYEDNSKAIERHKTKKLKTSESVKPKSIPALIDEAEYVENCIMDNDDDEEEVEDEEKKPREDRNSKKTEYDEDESNNIVTHPQATTISNFNDDNYTNTLSSVSHSSELIPMEYLKDKHELNSQQGDIFKIESITSGKLVDTDKRANDFDLTQSSDPQYNDAQSDTDSVTIEIGVKIGNEKIKIPVKESEICNLKIDWLIDEVSKTFKNLNHPNYYASLSITQGDLVTESDSLEILVNKELEIVLSKWKSLPLSQRYEKACLKGYHSDLSLEIKHNAFKRAVNNQVFEVFKNCSYARCFNLSNFKLSSLSLVPICKALMFESFIQILSLSNNCLGDKGIELIVKLFEKSIIEELDVSGCSITSSGVYYFSESLDKISEISRNGLVFLNLSNNPITDDAIDALNNIMEKLPNLRVLNVDRCQLECTISTKNNTNLEIIQEHY